MVDVHAPEAVGGLADVGPRIVCLHLLDLQAHPEDAEANPAAVDVASVFGPHDEGRGVSLHRTRQLDGAPDACRLPLGDLLGDTRRS